MQNTKRVYSTDTDKNIKCEKCGELPAECVCRPDADVSKTDFTAVLRVEKSGRKGKTVTVIDRLPKSENYLKDLAKKIKVKCGSGGTYKPDGEFGIIEIQGDKREIIRSFFKNEGIRCKG
ncbi:translation initiation factor [candidate division KSB1 bacterium]